MMLYIKKLLYYYFSLFEIRSKKNKKKWEKYNSPTEIEYNNSPIKIAIAKEAWNLHYHYIKACRELNISYKIIDFFSSNWLEQLSNSSFDILILRPSVQYQPWKDMFDNRIRLLNTYTNIKIFPSPELLWLWESKLKTYEWLQINQLPHIETYIFYNKDEALNFAKTTDLPIVYKANCGSGTSGVKIIKKKSYLFKLINKSFNSGLRTYRKHPSDKEHGYIILQKYLPNLLEWRIIRMGKYYFGFQKLKKGMFHSGSHQFSYGMPPLELLNFTRELTDKFKFYHLSIDYFINEKNHFFINEIQVYFGQHLDRELLRINNKSGRLIYNYTNNQWTFEEGSYCKNNMANIRLLTLIEELNEKI